MKNLFYCHFMKSICSCIFFILCPQGRAARLTSGDHVNLTHYAACFLGWISGTENGCRMNDIINFIIVRFQLFILTKYISVIKSTLLELVCLLLKTITFHAFIFFQN